MNFDKRKYPEEHQESYGDSGKNENDYVLPEDREPYSGSDRKPYYGDKSKNKGSIEQNDREPSL